MVRNLGVTLVTTAALLMVGCGKTGPQGPQGAQGLQGTQGVQGTQGTPGLKGSTGAPSESSEEADLQAPPPGEMGRQPTDPPEPYTSNGFTMNAIEYWGKCDYAGGQGVSFGWRTNGIESNRACALKTFNALKAALDAKPPELAELKALGGPSTIYLIMSDCTRPADTKHPASVWHYNGSPNGTGGLIKFHAVTVPAPTRPGDTSVACRVPTAQELYKFARETRDQIRRSGPAVRR